MTHRKLDLKATMADLIRDRTGAPEQAATRLAGDLLERLGQIDVAEHLAAEVVDAFGIALAAHHLRDDVFQFPGAPHSAARIASEAVTSRFRGDHQPPPVVAIDVDEVEQALSKIEFRDWEFRCVPAHEGQPTPGVQVTATVPDRRDGRGTIRISRSVGIRDGDVVAAAFQAVMRLEEHEAAEHFRYDGATVYNEHNPPTPPRGLPAVSHR